MRSLPAFLLVASLAACGGGKPATLAPDDTKIAIASIDARIQGDWKLERFVPVQPLGPALDALLAYQTASLVIHITPKHLAAESPSIHVARTYEIREAMGDRFTVVLYDDQGVPYVSRCDFTPDGAVEVLSESDPWRGTATLRRAP